MNMILKKCWKCKEIKTIDQFYRCRTCPDGYFTACKICSNAIKDEWRKTKGKLKAKAIDFRYHQSTKGKETNRLWRAKPEVKEKLRLRLKEYRKNNPEKNKARALVNKTRLEKQPCQNCKSTKNIHAHHPDYSKPLDVVWLCAQCHKLEHMKIEGNA